MYNSRKSIDAQTNVLNKLNGLDCPRKELINTYYFYEGGGGRRKGEGGIRRGIEWLKGEVIFAEYFGGENFYKRREEGGARTKGEENWRRGLTPEEELHSSNKEVAIGFIGT